jgi:Xaa-Pro dipeptidase
MSRVTQGVAKKFAEALRQSQFDCVLVTGSDNLNYLTGAALPFLDQVSGQLDRMILLLWRKEEAPVILCPREWESTLSRRSWIRRIFAYTVENREADGPTFFPTTQIMKSLKMFDKAGRVGIDMNRAPHSFVEHLRKAFPDTSFVGCEAWMKENRSVKTPEEIDLLADVAYRTDHGILGSAHHVLSTAWRPEKGLCEIIRVHCLERGLDATGYHSVSQGVSGKNAEMFWPMAPRFGVGGGKALGVGEMVRLEMQASLHGYWSDACRMLTMGKPSRAQAEAYNKLIFLRETTVRDLRPGAVCCSVFEAVRKAAKRKKIDLLSDLGVGHGIGVAVHEAPYLNAQDRTELREGMVLVLDPVVRGADREVMRSKDTVVITEKGSQIVGWYKDWREPYIALDSYQHGGG